MYVLQGSTVSGQVATSSDKSFSDSDLSKLWHLRLGHMSQKGLLILSKRGLLGDKNFSDIEFCEHCIFGKQKRISFGTGVHISQGILDYIHSDLWGPASESSLGGATYMLTFIDDYSRKVCAYFLKHKSDVFSSFK